MADYTKPERIWLKGNPTFTEKWVQQLIAEDPSILGLGDLDLLEQERSQTRAGRLDLLLRDDENRKRYEIELQLGATDESHIIRVIEYWDKERRKFPNWDHCAVLVAEEVNGRFLNVVDILNGKVPLIALQMQAFKVGDHTTLIFTKVVDEIELGSEFEEEEDLAETATDRGYWEKKASSESIGMADNLLSIARQFDQTLSLKYNKHYIGLTKDKEAFNFVLFKPKKNHLNAEFKIPKSSELDERIKDAGLDVLGYSKWNRYRIHLNKADLTDKRPVIAELLKQAYEFRTQ